MGISPELERTLESMLATLDGATIERDPRGTITPGLPQVASGDAIALLRQLAPKDFDWQGDQRFEFGETLGEGGMGLVRLATQRSLGRKVAIKTLKDGVDHERALIKTLQEAWVTGRLEHPNVVPVYDVGLDRQGRPLIVLKRIEGEQWAGVMHDEARVRRKYGADDLLEWNIGILMEICQALRFAHSRGIVHRDLKPENVMIGEFGEVYVVDWGLAVSLVDDGTGQLPLASEATAMAGTPCYMAPEMLGGEVSGISPRTDVYLVGSCLHEVLTGRPPHDGDTVREIISSVVSGPPRLPDSVSDELTRIVSRAMDFDPNARFENADQVRLALRGFLQHRGSRRLAARAEVRRLELESALASRDVARAHQLFAECRFGYRAAIEAWRDNQDAKRALRDTTLEMVRYELRNQDPVAALKLLGELDDVPEGLRESAESLRDQQAVTRQSLERLGKDEDRDTGMRTRAFVILVMGSVWVALPIANLATGFHPDLPYIRNGAFALSLLAGAVALWARESMSKTRINRGLAISLVLVFVLQFLLTLSASPLGLDVSSVRVMFLAQWALTTALASAMLELRLWPVAAAYAIGLLVAAYRRELIDWVMLVCNVVLVGVMLRMNRALHWAREVVTLRRADLARWRARSRSRR